MNFLPSLLRTGLRRGFLAPLLGLSFVAAVQAVQAAAPAPNTLEQVPGYYRQQIGDLYVTALFDGVVPLTRGQLLGVSRSRVESLVKPRHVPESDKGLQTAVNAYLVQRGDQLVLVDAGTAQCFGPGLGQVLANLKRAGYHPEDVNAVLLTHAHPDHLCGVLDAQGAAAYPNATLWLASAEAAHWQSAEAERQASEQMRPLFGMAQRALAPYVAAGRLHRFAATDTLPGGATAVPSPGHTPGHTSYLFDGGNRQQLLVWGDVLHYHAVQFAAPEASFEPDLNRPQAIASRRNLLARATRDGWWVGGAHLPFPGLGHVRAEGKAFAWVPAEFSPLPGTR